MGFTGIQITEIFHSLQGETSLSGIRFAFVRLTGCNLRCSYCDSTYAFKGGRPMAIEDILATIEPYHVKHVLLTGGEPLLQRNTPLLINALQKKGYSVSIETHGEVSIAEARSARIIMDIKTPGSLMSRGKFKDNLKFLKSGDEIKFVLTNESDYEWSKNLLKEISPELNQKKVEVIFSPVVATPASPKECKNFSLKWVAEKIVEDRLDVRLQTQLHKLIWGPEKTGV